MKKLDRDLLHKLHTADVVCHDCGTTYGNYHDSVSSVWEGTCDVCGETANVTESRDYRYLSKGIIAINNKYKQKGVTSQ